MSENEKPSYYAILPADVRYDKELAPTARIFYGEITCLANSSGVCFAKNAYFEKLYELSERQVIRIIQQLEEKGYIAVRREGKKREIVITDWSCSALTKMSAETDKNVSEKPDKNVSHNNTSNNNINIIYNPVFEKWYNAYPNKYNKQQTFKNWNNALKTHTAKELYTALLNYRRYIESRGVPKDYIVRSTNFLGRKGEFTAWLEEFNDTADNGVVSGARRSLPNDVAERIRGWQGEY